MQRIKGGLPPEKFAEFFGQRASDVVVAGTGWNGERVPEGARNSTLFYMMCHWRDLGMAWEEITLAGVGFDQRHCDPPMGWEAIKVLASSVLTRAPRTDAPTLDDWPPFVTATTWQAHLASQPARMPICGPLQTSMVGIVYAAPGVGKSNWGLGLVDASTRGQEFGYWSGAGQPCRAAYFDGEMYIRDLDDRLELYPGWNIDFQLSKDWPAGGLDLCDLDHQAMVMRLCASHRVIVLDTFLALTTSPDPRNPYSDDRWTVLAPLIAWARQRQKLLLFIDHANRQGQLSGSAAKERDVDFIIKLTRSEQLATDLAFRLEFKKYRGVWVPDCQPSDWALSDDGWQGSQFQNWKAKVARWKKDNNHIARKRGAQAICARDLDCHSNIVSKYW